MSRAPRIAWLGFSHSAGALRAAFKVRYTWGSCRATVTLGRDGRPTDVQADTCLGRDLFGTTGDAGLDGKLIQAATDRFNAARDAAVVAEFYEVSEQRRRGPAW